MKKLSVCFLAAVALLMSTASYASKEAGNGGGGIVCGASRALKSIMLLDYYRARHEWNKNIDLGPKNLSREEHIEVALKRLERLDPIWADQLRQRARDFMPLDANTLHGVRFPMINDARALSIPLGCTPRQIVIQQEPDGYAIPKRYSVEGDAWDEMDSTEQAGTILHEVIYREALKLGAQDSLGTQVVNAAISSPEFESIDRAAYSKLLAYAHLPENEYYESLKPKQLHLTFARPFAVSGTRLLGNEATFREDGTLESLLVAGNATIDLPKVRGKVSLGDGSKIDFFPNGAIHRIANCKWEGDRHYQSGAYWYRLGRIVLPVVFQSKEGDPESSELVLTETGELDFSSAEFLNNYDVRLARQQTARAINHGVVASVFGQCPVGYKYLLIQNYGSVGVILTDDTGNFAQSFDLRDGQSAHGLTHHHDDIASVTISSRENVALCLRSPLHGYYREPLLGGNLVLRTEALGSVKKGEWLALQFVYADRSTQVVQGRFIRSAKSDQFASIYLGLEMLRPSQGLDATGRLTVSLK